MTTGLPFLRTIAGNCAAGTSATVGGAASREMKSITTRTASWLPIPIAGMLSDCTVWPSNVDGIRPITREPMWAPLRKGLNRPVLLAGICRVFADGESTWYGTPWRVLIRSVAGAVSGNVVEQGDVELPEAWHSEFFCRIAWASETYTLASTARSAGIAGPVPVMAVSTVVLDGKSGTDFQLTVGTLPKAPVTETVERPDPVGLPYPAFEPQALSRVAEAIRTGRQTRLRVRTVDHPTRRTQRVPTSIR